MYQAKSKIVSHFIRSIRQKYETEIAPLAAPNPKKYPFIKKIIISFYKQWPWMQIWACRRRARWAEWTSQWLQWYRFPPWQRANHPEIANPIGDNGHPGVYFLPQLSTLDTSESPGQGNFIFRGCYYLPNKDAANYRSVILNSVVFIHFEWILKKAIPSFRSVWNAVRGCQYDFPCFPNLC